MTSWHSYPSIYNIGHANAKDLFLDDVIIEEKIDGSQFSFGIFDGVLRMRSKGVELNIEVPEKMFSLAVDYVKSVQHKLVNGYTYRGEYLKSKTHNTLQYERTPKNNIIIFDISPSEETYLSHAEKTKLAADLDLETVPLLFQGKVEDVQTLLAFLERTSVLGGAKIEGFVVKNYARFGRDKKVLLGKYVSEAFKEVHGSAWKEKNPGRSDVLEFLVARYKTPARWMKAIQHLKDAGKLEMSPKDIGHLMAEVRADIEKECKEEIKDQLYAWASEQILRQSTRGLPEFYKEYLLKQQFSVIADLDM